MGTYAIEFYESEDGFSPVDRWLERLSPAKQRAVLAALQEVLEVDGPEVCASPWGRHVAPGIFEVRIGHTAEQIMGMRGERLPAGHKVEPEPILLRIFCHAYGDRVVLLLAGYDKGDHPKPTYQQRQIQVAKKRLRDFQRRKRAGT